MTKTNAVSYRNTEIAAPRSAGISASALPGEIGAVWATPLAEGVPAVLAAVLFAVFLKRFGKKPLAA